MSDFAFPVLGQPVAPAPSAATDASAPTDETQSKPRLPLTAFSTVTHVPAEPRLPLTAFSTVTHVTAEPRLPLTAFSTVRHVTADPTKDTKGARTQVEYLRSQMHDASTAPAQLRDITLQELQQHRSSTDAWICLKGKVYDMSRYMQYHPGGAKILLKVSGTDATQLFLKHHAWVDADYILGSSLLGRLVQDDSGGMGDPSSHGKADIAQEDSVAAKV